MGIKTGGATGGSAVLAAAMAVASGYANVVLAAGWERMDEVDTRTGNFYISTAACKDFETRFGPDLFFLLRPHGQPLCLGLQRIRSDPGQDKLSKTIFMPTIHLMPNSQGNIRLSKSWPAPCPPIHSDSSNAVR